MNYESEIAALKAEQNAILLAHYYQDDDIQDIADFVGDSLELARKAAGTDADVIVFSGVRFMAEGAKILNPGKKVLIPDMAAGCSLEDSCPPKEFAAFCKAHPEHMVVTYINCSAEVKALSDIIVTSSNAEAIINSLPHDQKIIFAPDKYLGDYLNKKTGRNMLLWNGTCMVHERFSEEELVKLTVRHPAAHVIAHPECPAHLLRYAKFIGSTAKLIGYTAEHPGESFIVLTEPGILHEMKKRSQGSTFYEVPGISGGACISCNNCPYMKMNTLEKIYLCLKNGTPSIELSDDLIQRARKPLDRMLELSVNIGKK
ncbi:MAG: quinolinate synthase NadA [Alphaproteobacteria bacterium]|nr:quinolinate synthase NadA [Alphaproteobacteria bacterium]